MKDPVQRVSVKDLNKSEPIQLSSRELSTRFMVDTCLAVLSTAGAVMGHWARSPLLDPMAAAAEPEVTPVDQEGKLACQKTLWAAAERLQKIMDEDARWSLDFQLKTEKHFEEVAARQKEVLETQRVAAVYQAKLAAEYATPHFRYRPALLRLIDKSWMAILGTVEDLDNSLYGVGETAELALEAFDSAFKGELHPATVEWLKQREQNLETGAVDAPMPKVKNNELDQSGNRDVEESPSGGLQHPEHSDEAGEDLGFGGEQNPPTEPPAR